MAAPGRSEEHTSELQSHSDLVCRLLLEKKKHRTATPTATLSTNTTTETLPNISKHFQVKSYALFQLLQSRSDTSEFFFFNDTATTEIYTLSLHDALPI